VGYKNELVRACLRYYTECVDENGDPFDECQPIPTLNNVDLRSLIPSPETAPGCYLYIFEFFGWRKRSIPSDWISRDDVYNIYVQQIS
jgi:hypothetical protein